ncbi:MAG TPA: hypothetical protein VIM89_11180 [Mucilaginibacter sp.]
MNKTANCLILFVFITSLLSVACHHVTPEEKAKKDLEEQAKKSKLLLKSIQGVRYTEVKRVFDNGLSFNKDGYRLKPSWRLSFSSSDSVNIFNPKRNIFNNAPVMFDHDSIFNIAWAWLKLKCLNKDSLKFQVLKVKDRIIVDRKPNVFITLYSDRYIRDVLHTDTVKLWRPTKNDTLYIKHKAAQANINLDSAFAALQPVILESKRPDLVGVKKKEVNNSILDEMMPDDQYLSPEYDIFIKNAYADFSYSFSVWVDEHGKLIFRKSIIFLYPEFRKTIPDELKGIVNGYLKFYVKAIPGKTLGITHSSVIILNVKGTKG